MIDNNPRPNDDANSVDRLKKTISNMEAAEEAMQYAEGKELAKIKAKNERREGSIEGLNEEIRDDKRSKIRPDKK